ncbi:MAG: DUF1566 domain-containing protein [Candidatus Eisenbacteria bacterium]|nr:DUF1566 domain-containing protein [Candidatus Eisenbacteria bacterium]
MRRHHARASYRPFGPPQHGLSDPGLALHCQQGRVVLNPIERGRKMRRNSTARALGQVSDRDDSQPPREGPMKAIAAGLPAIILFILLLGTVAGPLPADEPRTPDDDPPREAALYVIVDTGLQTCYDDAIEIVCPQSGEPYDGQDAQYAGAQPDYVLSPDGLTVYDAKTGLTWQQAPDTNGDGEVDSTDKLTWAEFQNHPAQLNAESFGGYDDWRTPSIKELYSLIDFRGIDPSGFSGDPSELVPFIDTEYFAFAYGDESMGERLIDAQYWSDTEYVGTVFDGQAAVFGVNFADGRIKGYPREQGPGGVMRQFARYVRGAPDYGTNSFTDNEDGTITDEATGLMWMQADSGGGLNWEAALAYAESVSYAGYDDWRLPNAKELQSLVDYTRSPSTTGSAAIDPLFSCTEIIDEAGDPNYPFYWTGTTHRNWTQQPGAFGAYIAFGEALGYFGPPGMESWIDVHGAGAQRSDPKSGDPGEYPYGHGPQGDAIRIYNYVRCVRNAGDSSDTIDVDPDGARGLRLQAVPNPARTATTFHFNLPADERGIVEVLSIQGRRLRTLISEAGSASGRTLIWDGRASDGRRLAPGAYVIRLRTQNGSAAMRLFLVR